LVVHLCGIGAVKNGIQTSIFQGGADGVGIDLFLFSLGAA
jgi:hypothetical protein